MCNLWSKKLFLVPNPCCCCDLRCGVLWIGVLDMIIAIISLYYPISFARAEDADDINSDKRPVEPIQQESVPVFFEVEGPWSKSQTDFLDGTQAGLLLGINMKRENCYYVEIINGILLMVAASGLSNRNRMKFLICCWWLISRVICFCFLAILTTDLLQSTHGQVYRYGIFLIVKLVFDVYFLITVRYYAMECWDAYRYQRLINSILIRRDVPEATNAALRTKMMIENEKSAKKKHAKASTKHHQHEQRKQKSAKAKAMNKPNFQEEEGVPVWDRKNEVVFVGEDYTDWDPVLFQLRWDMADEIRKEKKARKHKIEIHAKHTKQEGNLEDPVEKANLRKVKRRKRKKTAKAANSKPSVLAAAPGKSLRKKNKVGDGSSKISSIPSNTKRKAKGVGQKKKNRKKKAKANVPTSESDSKVNVPPSKSKSKLPPSKSNSKVRK